MPPFLAPLFRAATYARWLHLLAVLLVGFLLSSAGLIGAGDAKFLAASALFVERGDASLFLVLTTAVLGYALTRWTWRAANSPVVP